MSAASRAAPFAGPLILLALLFVWLAGRRLLRPARPLQLPSKKEPLMSDLPNTSGEVPAAGPATAAPVSTAPAVPAPAVNPNKVVTSVVQTVQAHPDVPAHKAAGIITSILSGLYQAEPAIFAISRASPATQAEISLGLGLAEVIVGAFLHPAA